jgi:hypothetical protein
MVQGILGAQVNALLGQSNLMLHEEGYGRVSYMNVLPAQLCIYLKCLIRKDHLERPHGLPSGKVNGVIGQLCPRCGDPLDDMIHTSTH